MQQKGVALWPADPTVVTDLIFEAGQFLGLRIVRCIQKNIGTT